MKKVLIALVLLVVLAVGGISLYVNEIIGTAIERAGTYAMGVDTRVGFVRLRLTRADFRMNRFRIGNPAGFDEPSFLTLGSATIDVDPGTLRKPVIVIPEIRLDDIDVALERKGNKTNYGVILNNVGRFERGKPAGKAPPAEAPASQKRFIVNRILITNVDAYVEWSKLAADQTGLKVRIPEIELKNVGAENAEGVAMAELSNIVLKAILGSVARYGGDLPGAILGSLNGGLQGVERVPGVVVSGLGGSAAEKVGKAVGGEVGDAIMGVGGDASESVGNAVGDEAKKALGGLFGGDKEEKK